MKCEVCLGKGRESSTLGDLQRSPESHFKRSIEFLQLPLTTSNMSSYIFLSYSCTEVWALKVKDITSRSLHIWAGHHWVEKVSGTHCKEKSSQVLQ